jgi:hypothetical protein
MPDLRISELHAAERDTASAIWASLEARHGSGFLTTGWTWTSTWLEVFGDLVPHCFLVVEDAHGPVAITLVTEGVRQKRGPVPVRSIHLGTGGEPAESGIATEYRRLLVDPAHRDAASAAILEHLLAARGRWEEILFDAMPLDDIRPFLDHPGFWHVHQKPSPYADLERIRETGGDVIASLGKNTRASIRRSIRKYGTVHVSEAGSPASATAIMDELVTLHQASWNARGEPGVFADDRFHTFHRLLIPALLAEDRLLLMRVHTDDAPIGGIYGFHDAGRVLMYQSGFQIATQSSLKPGLVSHALVMQRLLDQGYRAYDFLIGDARYKQELSNAAQPLVFAVRSRLTPKQVLLHRARIRHYGPHLSLKDLTTAS